MCLICLGMPCAHAVAAIAFKHHRPEDFCHAWLTIGAYNETYNFFIQPTQGMEFWEETPYLKPVPPPLKSRAGRPKKQRRKDQNEEQVSSTKVKRKYPPVTCSKCGHKGHNIQGCRTPWVSPMPADWVPPPPPREEQGQTEIDLSQSQPMSQPNQSQDAPATVKLTELYFYFYSLISI